MASWLRRFFREDECCITPSPQYNDAKHFLLELESYGKEITAVNARYQEAVKQLDEVSAEMCDLMSRFPSLGSAHRCY
eukprot:CAMPEP_0177670326 /NCGR_PEP_ID=MMETSP0447-20121125/24017_1 /TAXON_ID=0 /ORGANISM="Stygamoeba regulata, Strain BSH-02190019" /LENGTH=77 /DNA_ID=CAMNT_0019177457 /DNA_START=102 /DNA_END=332 /DNA_ORIENTATION=+